MNKGDLVKSKADGELGIAHAIGDTKMLVFLGDGLTQEVEKAGWEPVPFKSGAPITANFAELVDAWYAYLQKIDRRPRIMQDR